MAIPFDKIQTGNPDLDRVQERIQQLASKIPTPTTPVVVTATSDYSCNGTEDVVHVDAQAGPVKVTLRSPDSSGKPVTIKQTNLPASGAKVNQVAIVTADGSKTIAGDATFLLDLSGTGSVTLTSDGIQHWPSSGSGGNPPAAPGGGTGLTYIGLNPIKVAGNVISYTGTNPPIPRPPVAVATPTLYVALGGNNGNDGLTEFTPKLTGLGAYDALPAAGGVIVMESGCKWSDGTEGGGVVDRNPIWLVDGPLVPPGWRKYKTVAILVSPSESPGQGGFNTKPRGVLLMDPVASDRFKSTGIWTVGPCQRFYISDCIIQGYMGTDVRAGWDFPRDSSGDPIGVPVTSAVRSAGQTVFTLGSRTFNVAQASRTSGVVTLRVPLTSFPQGVLAISSLCTFSFTSTSGLFPGGTFTALITGSDGTNGLVEFSQGGGDVGVVSIPGSSFTTHGMGVGDRFDIVSTDANFPSTMYGKITAATLTTVTVNDPYTPASATGTNIGNAFYQDRASFAYYLNSIENVFGQLGGNGGPDQVWKGPAVDLGCSGFGGPSVFHDNCSWVGNVLIAPNVCPDPDRACAILMDGGAGPVTGPTLVNSRLTTQFGGIRCYAGVASTIVVDNMLQDTAIGSNSPPCMELFNANGANSAIVLLNNMQNADAINGGDPNVILHDTTASGVYVSGGCGLVQGACTIAANAPDDVWFGYTGHLPNFNRQVGPWGRRSLAGYHPASRLIYAPQTVRSRTIFNDNPVTWASVGNCTVVPGHIAADGTPTAFRMTPSGGSPFLLFFDGNVDPVTGSPMVSSIGDQWAIFLEIRSVSGSTSAPTVEYAFHPNDAFGLSLHPAPDTGNDGGWRFYGDWGIVDHLPFGSSSGIRCVIQGDASTVWDFRITLLRVPVGTMSDNEFADIMATMRHAPTYLTPGIAGTMNTQPLIAHGGIGVDVSVPVTPSGTASPTKNLPLLKADGTVQGYIPVIPTNSALPAGAGTVTAVTATAPVTSTGGTTPNVALTTDASLGVSGGALQRAALTGDATASAGSNAVTVPGLYKVKFNGADASPDYLGAKITSTSGNIAVTSIAGTQVNLNALLPTSITYFMNVPALSVASSGWIAPNDALNFYSSTVIELPAPFIVQHVTVTANLIVNGIPSGTVTVVATRNSSHVIGAVANFISSTPPGSYSSGPIATGSVSALDTYGLFWNSGPPSGNITVSFTVTLDAF